MAGPKADPCGRRQEGEPDRAELLDLFTGHAAWLQATLQQRLRLQPAEADDIVQDVWLRLLRAPRVAVDHPRALLSRIALNLFRDRRRREAVRASHRAAVIGALAQSAAWNGQNEQEIRLEMERLILALPPLYREAFLLSRFGRMTHAEIAVHLDVSVKTVEYRIGKALELCLSGLQG